MFHMSYQKTPQDSLKCEKSLFLVILPVIIVSHGWKESHNIGIITEPLMLNAALRKDSGERDRD